MMNDRDYLQRAITFGMRFNNFKVKSIEFSSFIPLTDDGKLKVYENLKRFVPDGNLRRRLNYNYITWVPLDYDLITQNLNELLNIENYDILYPYHQILKLPKEWDKRFFKYKLSADYLRRVLEMEIKSENHEAVLVIEKKLAEMGALDEGGRFDL